MAKSRWARLGKVSKRAWRRAGRRVPGWAWLTAAAGLAGGLSAHGQESLRMSLASEEAAEARREAAQLGYCNLRMGSVTARVQASVGMELSDNIDYSVAKRTDVAFRPGVTVKSLWPITDLNSLYVSTGLGYIKYFRHSDLDSFYITPDSAVTFQMYSGDFLINLHDRFSLTESGGQTPSINAANGYGRIENTAGASVDWDLNDLILSAGYDHDYLSATKTVFDYVDRNSELIAARGTYLLSSHVRAGVEGGGGYNYYSATRFPSSFYFTGGAFAEVDISKFLKTRLSAGYVNYMFPDVSLNGKKNMDSYYARWSIDHQISKRLKQTLALQHNLSLGEWYAVGELDSVSYSVNWAAGKRLNVIGSIGYYSGNVFRPSEEKLSWLGPSIYCTYQIGPKLTASAGYWFSRLNSDAARSSYSQNRLALNLTYTF